MSDSGAGAITGVAVTFSGVGGDAVAGAAANGGMPSAAPEGMVPAPPDPFCNDGLSSLRDRPCFHCSQEPAYRSEDFTKAAGIMHDADASIATGCFARHHYKLASSVAACASRT